MITLDDILDMTCLTRSEIAAIAEHDGLDGVHAAAYGDYLMHLHHGPQQVQRMICEDVRAALHAHDLAHARILFQTLRQFIADHPEAARGAD
ncbi:hypothetical protein ACFQXB_07220 [Plastorhodobacter daqingensis]|uniref:Uncharacterized protein n=1 Tax=Plastorhodobacter daqingensis TaxID=1387281 RepID=A0ABW2UL32_9RHOB